MQFSKALSPIFVTGMFESSTFKIDGITTSVGSSIKPTTSALPWDTLYLILSITIVGTTGPSDWDKFISIT